MAHSANFINTNNLLFSLTMAIILQIKHFAFLTSKI